MDAWLDRLPVSPGSAAMVGTPAGGHRPVPVAVVAGADGGSLALGREAGALPLASARSHVDLGRSLSFLASLAEENALSSACSTGRRSRLVAGLRPRPCYRLGPCSWCCRRFTVGTTRRHGAEGIKKYLHPDTKIEALGHAVLWLSFYVDAPMDRVDSLEEFFAKPTRSERWVLTTKAVFDDLRPRYQIEKLIISPKSRRRSTNRCSSNSVPRCRHRPQTERQPTSAIAAIPRELPATLSTP